MNDFVQIPTIDACDQNTRLTQISLNIANKKTLCAFEYKYLIQKVYF